MKEDDPYHDFKDYHLAREFKDDGGVVALCYRSRRSIDLRRALWTNRPEAVTCPKCRKLLRGPAG